MGFKRRQVKLNPRRHTLDLDPAPYCRDSLQYAFDHVNGTGPEVFTIQYEGKAQ